VGEWGDGTGAHVDGTVWGGIDVHEFVHVRVPDAFGVVCGDGVRAAAGGGDGGAVPVSGPDDTDAGGGVVENAIDAGSDSKVTSVMFVTMGPFLRWMMRRQLAKELRGLKSLLEG